MEEGEEGGRKERHRHRGGEEEDEGEEEVVRRVLGQEQCQELPVEAHGGQALVQAEGGRGGVGGLGNDQN